MRCEVNISLYEKGRDKLSGTKVEIKNLNSFKVVEKSIDYEIERQAEALKKGKKIIQETRGWDENKSATVSQREKESAHDYRYFPEPDIPTLRFTQEYIENLRKKLPELPDAKEKRFIEEYNLSPENVGVIVGDKNLADYFEHVVSEIKEKMDCGELNVDEKKCVKLAANYMVSELQKHLIKHKETIEEIKITPENYAELVGFVADGKISSSGVQIVLEEMYRTGGDPSQIIEEKNLLQVSDEKHLEEIINKVLGEHQKSAEDYKSGKGNALQFLVGQVMKLSQGKANPQIAKKLLENKLK
jgi:aspartyl-tRNA(Asn)/glutamyl-tRNA(Gln) amidotransferase subunit B